MTIPTSLKKLLSARAAEVRRLEAQAQTSLLQDGDRQAHREHLEAKCRLLQTLPDEAEPLVRSLPEAEQLRVMEQLDSMAFRAGRALGMGSVFFMANLLYPDAYKDGDKNELESFIDTLG